MLVEVDEPVTLCCSVKGCRPKSSTCILTWYGKPMMLLEGNGFIKVLTPMRAAVWVPVVLVTGCLEWELALLFHVESCFSGLNSTRQGK